MLPSNPAPIVTRYDDPARDELARRLYVAVNRPQDALRRLNVTLPDPCVCAWSMGQTQ